MYGTADVVFCAGKTNVESRYDNCMKKYIYSVGLTDIDRTFVATVQKCEQTLNMFCQISDSIFDMIVDEPDWYTNEENKNQLQHVGMFDKQQCHRNRQVENVVRIRKTQRMPPKTVHDPDRRGLVTLVE